jgi:copper homeostasis protein
MPETTAYRIEVCVVSYEQAIAADQNGAARLELCSRLETEGMTPGEGLLSTILEKVTIPVRIMIRETEVGFESDASILEKMKWAISQFKSLSIDGFVIGLLKNNRLDREAMKDLIECCVPKPVTVHKAIDHSHDVHDDILWLNQFDNVDTILTSGGQRTALEGIDQILKMKSVFERNIMAAGKITNDQLPFLHTALQLPWYHGRNIL